MPTLSPSVPQRHNVKSLNDVPDRHNFESDVLARILCQLGGDYSAATILFSLLQMHADRGFVKASYRALSERCAHLPFKVAERAIKRLAAAGLIEVSIQPRVVTSYRVDGDAFRRLLSEPLPEGVLIPGMTPIPALKRLFADSPDPATAESIASSNPED